ncbi:MAG: potassium channel family protein [Propionibacteriaceae bacterium]
MAESAARVAGPRVAAWERRTEWPLAVLAVIFLAAYSVDVLDTRLDSTWHTACRITDYLIWLLFVADYVVRVALADSRARYVWRHLVDLVIVALPALRPLRLLRLVMLLRVLHRRATDSLRGRLAYYIAGSAIVLVYCAALAVLDAERGRPGANIETFGDALWWAVTTVTTVGYGDHVPVTTEGRFVAAGLMIGGVTLIGAVSASFATWLIERVRAVEDDAEAATRRDMHALRAQLDRIEARLTALDEIAQRDRHTSGRP